MAGNWGDRSWLIEQIIQVIQSIESLEKLGNILRFARHIA